jgi:hypothetical protein
MDLVGSYKPLIDKTTPKSSFKKAFMSEKDIQITIRKNNEDFLKISTTKHTTVDDLKYAIGVSTNVTVQKQLLMFGDSIVESGKLRDYSLKSGSVLNMFVLDE